MVNVFDNVAAKSTARCPVSEPPVATTMFLPLLLAPSLKRNFVQTSHVGGVMALRGVNVVPTGRG